MRGTADSQVPRPSRREGTVATWAAVARVYATLAVAAGIEAASISRGRAQIPTPGIAPPVMPEPGLPGTGPLPGLDP